MYDYVRTKLPLSFRNIFKFNCDVYDAYITRRAQMFHIPKTKSRFVDKLPLYNFPSMWNNWCTQLNVNSSRGALKNSMKTILMNDYATLVKCEKICILYGFPCEMDFSHHESPNSTRVAKRRGWDSETSGEKIHLTWKTIQNAFSRIRYTSMRAQYISQSVKPINIKRRNEPPLLLTVVVFEKVLPLFKHHKIVRIA